MTSDHVQVSDQQALVIELMQALESGVHGEELRRFFHEDAEQIEYPSLVDPRVGRRGLDGMIAASELGAGILAFQRYDVNRWIESEDTVVCQAEWHAELAKDAGTMHRGQRLPLGSASSRSWTREITCVGPCCCMLSSSSGHSAAA